MKLLECTEVGNARIGSIGIDLQNGVREGGMCVRTASAGHQGVHLRADEGNVSDTEHVSDASAGRGQCLNQSGASAARSDFGNAGIPATCPRADGSRNLLALADRRSSATGASFGDVEIAIRSPLQAARIVESGCKNGNVG